MSKYYLKIFCCDTVARCYGGSKTKVYNELAKYGFEVQKDGSVRSVLNDDVVKHICDTLKLVDEGYTYEINITRKTPVKKDVIFYGSVHKDKNEHVFISNNMRIKFPYCNGNKKYFAKFVDAEWYSSRSKTSYKPGLNEGYTYYSRIENIFEHVGCFGSNVLILDIPDIANVVPDPAYPGRSFYSDLVCVEKMLDITKLKDFMELVNFGARVDTSIMGYASLYLPDIFTYLKYNYPRIYKKYKEQERRMRDDTI